MEVNLVKLGPVERKIEHLITKNGAIHLTLIDPDKVSVKDAITTAKIAEKVGSSAILVGGSIGVTSHEVDQIVKSLKKTVKLPIIIFPGSISNLTPYADAVLYISLLNSQNTFFIIGAQVSAAPIIWKYRLETIPTAYLIMGEGGAAGFMGDAKPIPYTRPQIAAAYALAAQMMGMHYIYLEGGSGTNTPIPQLVISNVRKFVGIRIIVGGGIRDKNSAKNAVAAGADMIVTGTITEGISSEELEYRLNDIINGIKEGIKLRSDFSQKS